MTTVSSLDTVDAEAADGIDAALLKTLGHGDKDTGGTLPPMRVLVVGAGGMLGREVVAKAGDEVLGLTRTEFDISDPTASAELAAGKWGAFDAIVNCAAYTAVDKAEEDRQAAYETNALGPGYLAQAAARLGARLIHISTDFVFDGSATTPYREDAPTNPLGVYGESKLQGEEAVRVAGADWTILRTAWLYGVFGRCFRRSILNAFEAGKSLRVVADQIGSPTSARELATVIWRVLEERVPPGLYHAAGPEAMSWHGFAQRIVSAAGGNPDRVEEIKTSDWPTPAKRPAYSVLDSSKLGMPMRADALDEFVQDSRQS